MKLSQYKGFCYYLSTTFQAVISTFIIVHTAIMSSPGPFTLSIQPLKKRKKKSLGYTCQETGKPLKQLQSNLKQLQRRALRHQAIELPNSVFYRSQRSMAKHWMFSALYPCKN